MRVAEMGEFGLIARLEQIVAASRSDVCVGIGDDAAVLDTGDDELLLATVDSQVEHVHFLTTAGSADQLGRRALAINLSDIAAMGGRPQFALVSLSLPSDTPVTWVEDLYRGLRVEADSAGVAVIGGNVTRSPSGIHVDVTVLGRVRREHLLLRSGARPGDRVLVTGSLGESAAGLRIALDKALPVEDTERDALFARYLTPTARLKESALVASSGLATSMIDLSDGLSSDVGHICEQSSVGVRLWAARLPMSTATRHVAAAISIAPWRLALSGGEDYELCFTAPPEAAATLLATVSTGSGTAVTEVGEILAAENGRRLVLPDGREAPLEACGWDHFASV